MLSPVSIPFKRESVSKGELLSESFCRVYGFQFPSNGKVYPKYKVVKAWVLNPKFQFPSNGKVYPKEDDFVPARAVEVNEFQFPSNGKVYPKLFRVI